MLIYCATRFKPKKKRQVKGVVAQKYRRSEAVSGVFSIPSLSYGPRVGASDAKKIKSLNTDCFFTEKKEILIEEIKEIERQIEKCRLAKKNCSKLKSELVRLIIELDSVEQDNEYDD